MNAICGVNKIHRGNGTRSRAKAKDREIVKWDKLIGALLSTAKTHFAMEQKNECGDSGDRNRFAWRNHSRFMHRDRQLFYSIIISLDHKLQLSRSCRLTSGNASRVNGQCVRRIQLHTESSPPNRSSIDTANIFIHFLWQGDELSPPKFGNQRITSTQIPKHTLIAFQRN